MVTDSERKAAILALATLKARLEEMTYTNRTLTITEFQTMLRQSIHELRKTDAEVTNGEKE